MGDPLGVESQNIDLSTLTRWNNTAVPSYSEGPPLENKEPPIPSQHPESPFAVDNVINSKVALWCGDLSCLTVDAVVNSTNEALTDRANSFSDRLLRRAGAELLIELKKNVRVCKTGEARLTRGYNLPARHVIHTVGPRYQVKYRSAAQTALHASYRSVLKLARENNIRSVGLCCVHSAKRGYPETEGAHIALRTVRRFLEHFSDGFDLVVLVVTPLEEPVYTETMPMYFPRSTVEADALLSRLPSDLGDPVWGEPIIEERRIRIGETPLMLGVGLGPKDTTENEANGANLTDDNFEVLEPETADEFKGLSAFAKMSADPDRVRSAHHHSYHYKQQHGSSVPSDFTVSSSSSNAFSSSNVPTSAYSVSSSEQQNDSDMTSRYQSALRQANQADLSSIDQLGCLHRTGFDSAGRPVLVFEAARIPPIPSSPPSSLSSSNGSSTHSSPTGQLDVEKAILYLIRLLESMIAIQQSSSSGSSSSYRGARNNNCTGSFVVVYLHAQVNRKQRIPTWVLEHIYQLIDCRFRSKLHRLYLVHPSMLSRVALWWFTSTGDRAHLKPKVVPVHTLAQLFTYIPPDQLDLPQYVVDYDRKVNASVYANQNTSLTSNRQFLSDNDEQSAHPL